MSFSYSKQDISGISAVWFALARVAQVEHGKLVSCFNIIFFHISWGITFGYLRYLKYLNPMEFASISFHSNPLQLLTTFTSSKTSFSVFIFGRWRHPYIFRPQNVICFWEYHFVLKQGKLKLKKPPKSVTKWGLKNSVFPEQVSVCLTPYFTTRHSRNANFKNPITFTRRLDLYFYDLMGCCEYESLSKY